MDAANQENRNLQYAMAGIYIANQSRILFALWDGKPAQGLGGTAQVVQYLATGHLQGAGVPDDQIRRLQPLASMSTPDDMVLIRHIPVRRERAPTETVGAPRWLDSAEACRLNASDPHDSMPTPIFRMHAALEKIDALNAGLTKIRVKPRPSGRGRIAITS
jgi:hypothetical protein